MELEGRDGGGGKVMEVEVEVMELEVMEWR